MLDLIVLGLDPLLLHLILHDLLVHDALLDQVAEELDESTERVVAPLEDGLEVAAVD